ncbi:MAG: hypothetical protein ACI8V2_001169, partial [Candidatus Latescibacterota bacterium]
MSRWKSIFKYISVVALVGFMTSVALPSGVWGQTPPPPTTDPQGGTQPPVPDFATWVASQDAKDLNGDTVINEADYDLFLASLPQPGAGDGTQQGGDSQGGAQPPVPDFSTWVASQDAKDLNGDTVINEADYDLFLASLPQPGDGGGGDGDGDGQGPPILDFATWSASDEAADLNADGVVDEGDFKLFVDS